MSSIFYKVSFLAILALCAGFMYQGWKNKVRERMSLVGFSFFNDGYTFPDGYVSEFRRRFSADLAKIDNVDRINELPGMVYEDKEHFWKRVRGELGVNMNDTNPNNLDRYLSPIKGKLQIKDWIQVKDGYELTYNISCRETPDRIKFYLPFKGHGLSSSEIEFYLDNNMLRFPVNKLPFMAEYAFVIDNRGKKETMTFKIHFLIQDELPALLSKRALEEIKVLGQNLVTEDITKRDKRVVMPRTYTYYESPSTYYENLSKCQVTRLEKN